jgi:hypothetical protein
VETVDGAGTAVTATRVDGDGAGTTRG